VSVYHEKITVHIHVRANRPPRLPFPRASSEDATMRPGQRNSHSKAADLHVSIVPRTKYDDVAFTAVIEGRECYRTRQEVVDLVAENGV
jgi:hypothetical protein